MTNILFMIADDHRHDAIHALGNEDLRTPTFDRLIADGTAFTHTHIMGSTSGAVCMPSRGMVLTGRGLFHAFDYSERSEWAYDIREETPLLPEWLRQEGYYTYGVGKWHNRKSAFARSFEGGAKIFFGGMSDHDAVPVHDFDPSGVYPDDQHYTGEKFSTELFADAAVDFLQSYHSDQPFFLYVAFTAPHDPRTPPPDYTYDPDSLPLPGNFLPQHPFDNGELRVRDEELAAFPRTPAEIRQHIADYYGMISHLDAGVGRILTALAESGHAEDTIVVYTADHGLAVGQHGLMGKQNLYNHSIRIPLIMRGPHIPAGQRHDALCYLFDLFPTLCELVDAPLPPSNEGDSLLPLLTGAKSTHRASLYHAYQSPVENHDQIQRAVRDTRYKLIEYAINGQHTTQLFDLLEDPLETHNLVDDSRYNDRLQALKQLLGQWQHLVDDPLQ